MINNNIKGCVKSVYIHIPFCTNICSYCDFCKIYYDENKINKYLDALYLEIKNNYKNELIDTIYIGGGTPSSLKKKELIKLFNILKIFKLSNNYEFTFECNIENIDEEKAKILYQNHVNRISIGIQTFNNNLLSKLGRCHKKEDVFDKIKILKKIGFNNINVDFIYALPNESLEDVKEDINLFLKLGINHISTYSLIIEPNTSLYINNIKNIDEELDLNMYNYICDTLTKEGFKHYEISNFAKEGYESKHNLTYWNNKEYYGFGLGASGYIDSVRYTNTRSFKHYINNINYRIENNLLSKQEKMENEMILGLRKIDGVRKQDFKDKYGLNIEDVFDIRNLLKTNKIIDNGINIYINPKYLYIQNSILIDFIGG